MLLADEYFFVALDDRTGRPRLSPKVFALGVAGALLGELALEERVGVDGDHNLRVPRRRQAPPADALAHQTLDHLMAEPNILPVRTWLGFLAQRATDQVAERLWRAGYIRCEQVRRLFRTETIYPPVDINTAYGPTAMLSNDLRTGRPMTWQQAALAGLVVATGLESHILYTADADARAYLKHILGQLFPTLHALVVHLQAAVGDAVLTGRT